MDKEIQIKIEEEDFSYERADFGDSINIKIETDDFSVDFNDSEDDEKLKQSNSNGIDNEDVGMELEESPTQLPPFDSVKIKIEPNESDSYYQSDSKTNISRFSSVKIKTEPDLDMTAAGN